MVYCSIDCKGVISFSSSNNFNRLLLDRCPSPLHEIKHVRFVSFIGYVFHGYQSLRADVCAVDPWRDLGGSYNRTPLLSGSGLESTVGCPGEIKGL